MHQYEDITSKYVSVISVRFILRGNISVDLMASWVGGFPGFMPLGHDSVPQTIIIWFDILYCSS